MAVRSFQDLYCWQRANELKVAVYEIIDRTPARTDVRFCNQLKDAAASGPSNLAEAFGCYVHGEAARYARIAKGSLTETQNHLLDGVDRKYWTDAVIEPLMLKASKAIGATVRWIHYLQSSKAP